MPLWKDCSAGYGKKKIKLVVDEIIKSQPAFFF